MARKRKPEEKNIGTDDWMTTYGDLVTLLLTFFVLLFSFSTIDAQKWKSLVAAFAGNASILEGDPEIGDTPQPGDIPDMDNPADLMPGEDDNQLEDGDRETEEFFQLYRAIEVFLDDKGIPGEVEISEAHTEILLRFKESVLFDSGKADIKNDAEEVLNGISDVLLEFDKEISQVRIDGHADIVPVNTRVYATNWELSAHRSVNVVRYFNEERGFEASKLFAAAYGEHHPIDKKTTAEALSKNRRVEFFIVKAVKPNDMIELED